MHDLFVDEGEFVCSLSMMYIKVSHKILRSRQISSLCICKRERDSEILIVHTNDPLSVVPKRLCIPQEHWSIKYCIFTGFMWMHVFHTNERLPEVSPYSMPSFSSFMININGMHPMTFTSSTGLHIFEMRTWKKEHHSAFEPLPTRQRWQRSE